MKESKNYLDELESLSSNTDLVSSDNLYNSVIASFAYYNSGLARLTVKKAMYFEENNKPLESGKMPSVTSIDKKWDATEDGRQMILLKAEVENLKAISKAVDSHNFNLRSEARLSH